MNSQIPGPKGMSDGVMTPEKKTLSTFLVPALLAWNCPDHTVDDND